MELKSKLKETGVKQNKDLRNRIRYTASFDKKLFEEARNLSLELNIPLTKLLDEGLGLLIYQDKDILREKFGR